MDSNKVWIEKEGRRKLVASHIANGKTARREGWRIVTAPKVASLPPIVKEAPAETVTDDATGFETIEEVPAPKATKPTRKSPNTTQK